MTGSVADSVAPTERASTKVMDRPSRGMRVQTQRIRPSDMAEISVPANANVRILPMLRKKLACAVSLGGSLDWVRTHLV